MSFNISEPVSLCAKWGLNENSEIPATSHILRSSTNLARYTLAATQPRLVLGITFLDFLFRVPPSNRNMSRVLYRRDPQLRGYRVGHSWLSCAAVKIPSISVAFNNSVLFSLTLRVHQGTAVELLQVSLPGPRLVEQSLSGHCCSSGRGRRNTSNKLALKTTVRESHTSLLPTFYWPNQVTWFLLSLTKREWIINSLAEKHDRGRKQKVTNTSTIFHRCQWTIYLLSWKVICS